jgi:SAM-dependent methyltransferase
MYLTRRLTDEDELFLNFAYEEDPPMGMPLEPADERNRGCIQLYHATASQVDLNGKKVLEVGCGHGGGASYIKRYLGPASYTGLDLNPTGVAFCRKRHQEPGLDFVQGDAQDLPFPDQSFDAVVNVESANYYPDQAKFFNEVARVLRPGGHFLYTDCQPAAGVEVGEPRWPTPRCASSSIAISMLRPCSGWSGIRSTGWRSSTAMRRHFCGAPSAKAPPSTGRGITRV